MVLYLSSVNCEQDEDEALLVSSDNSASNTNNDTAFEISKKMKRVKCS